MDVQLSGHINENTRATMSAADISAVPMGWAYARCDRTRSVGDSIVTIYEFLDIICFIGFKCRSLAFQQSKSIDTILHLTGGGNPRE
jgi:hypothetical protein